MKKQEDSLFDRREFIKMTSGAAIAITASPLILSSCGGNGMPMRKLGRTGKMVSVLAVGGLHMSQKEVPDGSSSVQIPVEEGIKIVRGAIDQGVTFLDNAYAYNWGKSEEHMGLALKDGYREKVMLMTKTSAKNPEDASMQLETSLKRLQVDYLDVLQFHKMTDETDIEALYKKDGLIDWAIKQRDAGLIKYIGFTGHFNPAVHIEIIRRGFEWDTVQFPVNLADFNHPGMSFIRDVLPLAVEKNIGIISMKTNAYGRPWIREVATAAEGLRYAMSLPVSTMPSGMTSFEIMNENVATVKNTKPMNEEEVLAYVARLKDIPADLEDYRRDFKPREVQET